MDEDQAVEVARRTCGEGWVAQDYTGEWNFFAAKPIICDGDNFWSTDPNDPRSEMREIGFSDWSKYWRDSLREVT